MSEQREAAPIAVHDHGTGNYCGVCGRPNWWLCRDGHRASTDGQFCSHCGIERVAEAPTPRRAPASG